MTSIRIKQIFKGTFLALALAAVVSSIPYYGKQVILYQRHKDLISSIEKVQQNQYTDAYQCLDFSKDLVNDLKSRGIDSQVDIVQTEGRSDEYHAVISLQIEPQDGKVVSYKTVDRCRLVNGNLDCESGKIQDGKFYVAFKK